MKTIAEAKAYTIPMKDRDHYVSIATDFPAVSIKMQLRSMTTSRDVSTVELDAKAARMLIKALSDLVKGVS